MIYTHKEAAGDYFVGKRLKEPPLFFANLCFCCVYFYSYHFPLTYTHFIRAKGEKKSCRAEGVNSLCVWPVAKFSRQKSAQNLFKRKRREENQDRSSVAFESTFQKGFILGFRPTQEKALFRKTACFAEAAAMALVCTNKIEEKKRAKEGWRKRRVIKRARILLPEASLKFLKRQRRGAQTHLRVPCIS